MPPYQAGETVIVTVDGEDREAVVSMLVETNAMDPTRRWRLLCRWADEPEGTIETPLYCDSEGTSPEVKPLDRDVSQ